MNPWLWLLWATLAIALLFVATAVLAGIVDGIRKPSTCPHCGRPITRKDTRS